MKQLKLTDFRLAVISDAAPARNGVGAYYQDLVQHMEAYLGQVAVFSPLIADGRWRAGMSLPMPGDTTQRMCMPNPVSLKRWLEEVQPHAVIIPTPGPYGLLGAYLANRMGVPVITGFHTSFEQLTDLYWSGSVMGKIAYRYFDRSHRYLFGKATEVLANSENMLELAHQLGASSPMLMGTPIPAEFINTPVRPHSGTIRRCLFAGRLAAEKNVAAVFAAARSHPGIEFTMAGDGPLRREVEHQTSQLNNLTYLGWLSRRGLRQQIDAHDALVLPSHFESFGTVALEAMMRQRIAVVSKGCGIAQWPDLTDQLTVISPTMELSEALEVLQNQSSSDLLSQSQSGAEAAMKVHNQCISHWLQVLTQSTNTLPVAA